MSNGTTSDPSPLLLPLEASCGISSLEIWNGYSGCRPHPYLLFSPLEASSDLFET
jgi:hypothetical protein